MSQLLIPELEKEIFLIDSYIGEYLSPVAFNHAVEEILTEIQASRGKKIRPKLLLLAGRCGRDYERERDKIYRLGALLELIHLASLIHDDIVDDSPLRRGRRTIQDRFGKDMAVYAGDLVLSRVMKELFSCGYMEEGSLFAAIIEKMCSGEIGQYDCMFRPDITVEDYCSNIYGKTAALFEGACILGASVSGCDPGLTETLGQIGKEFGLLFQMRDDFLDFVSEEKEEGKPIQMDFREGILTLPVLYAVEEEEYRGIICDLMESAKAGRFTDRHREDLSSCIRASGGMRKAADTYDDLLFRVRNRIRKIPGQKEQEIFQMILEKLMLDRNRLGTPQGMTG